MRNCGAAPCVPPATYFLNFYVFLLLFLSLLKNLVLRVVLRAPRRRGTCLADSINQVYALLMTATEKDEGSSLEARLASAVQSEHLSVA